MSIRILSACLVASLVVSGCGPRAEPEAAAEMPPVVVDEAAAPAEIVAPTAEMAAPAEVAADEAAAGQTVYVIDPARSEARYEVGETFFKDNRFAVAVGRTTGISGEVLIDESDPTASRVEGIEVDVSQLKSDSDKRDRFISEQSLTTGQFPTARFVGTAISGLPASPKRGEPVTFQLTGDLTVYQTTLPVTWQVTATLGADMLSGTATTQVLMSDYGIGPIEIMQLGTEDAVKLALDFVAIPR